MCIKEFNFPNKANVTSVIALGKRKSNKYDMSNFIPASTLNTFPKIKVTFQSN